MCIYRLKQDLTGWPGFEGAVDYIYPNRTATPLPSSASVQNLTGDYYNAGYGKLSFKSTGKNDSSLELVAERPDLVYQYNVRLEHVSGDDWVAYFRSVVGSLLPSQYFQAKFKVDGKVSALDILMGDGTTGTKPFNVTFNKIA